MTVDELVALAQVFETPVAELLVPWELVADRKALKLVREYTEARAAAEAAWFRLASHTSRHPRVAAIVDANWSAADLKFGAAVSMDRWRQKYAAMSAERRASFDAALYREMDKELSGEGESK